MGSTPEICAEGFECSSDSPTCRSPTARTASREVSNKRESPARAKNLTLGFHCPRFGSNRTGRSRTNWRAREISGAVPAAKDTAAPAHKAKQQNRRTRIVPIELLKTRSSLGSSIVAENRLARRRLKLALTGCYNRGDVTGRRRFCSL